MAMALVTAETSISPDTREREESEKERERESQLLKKNKIEMKELRLMYWLFSDTLCLLIQSFGVKHPSFNAKSYRDVAFGLNFCILPRRRPEILELFLNLTLLVYNMLHFNYTTVLVKETVTPKQHMDLITHPGKSRTSGFFFLL